MTHSIYRLSISTVLLDVKSSFVDGDVEAEVTEQSASTAEA